MAQATETKTTTAVAADPAPLGLIGFATTTLLAGAFYAGFTGVTPASFIGLAFFFGGGAQLLAGMWEFRNGNTFGGVAFSSYGAFWLAVWYSLTNSAITADFLKSSNNGWFLLGWTIVTGIYLIGTLRLHYGLVAVFGLLFLTFLLLCIGQFNGAAPGSGLTSVAGYVAILTAVAAYYNALAGILKSTSGGSINLPVGPIKR